ncbi:MAG: histidine kinase, partial [Spirochaetales bacterium]|nr:histidine kinase [Candidatus Physcosoma equi]
MMATVSDFLGWIFLQPKVPLTLFLARFINFALFFLQNVGWWVWLLYVYSFITIHHKSTRRRAFFICSTLPMLLSLCILLVNCFTGILFRVDYTNGYARGPLHILNNVFTFMYIIWFFILCVREMRRTDDKKHKRHLRYLLSFAVLPILGVVTEQMLYGISVSPTATFLGILLVYLNVQQERVNAAKEETQEALRQLEDSKVKIMLSQIKPHFLFNTLNIIRALCRKDPESAVEA